MTYQETLEAGLKHFREEYKNAYTGILSDELLESNEWFESFLTSFAEKIKGSVVAESLRASVFAEVNRLTTDFPERESDEYDAGYAKAKSDILALITK